MKKLAKNKSKWVSVFKACIETFFPLIDLNNINSKRRRKTDLWWHLMPSCRIPWSQWTTMSHQVADWTPEFLDSAMKVAKYSVKAFPNSLILMNDQKTLNLQRHMYLQHQLMILGMHLSSWMNRHCRRTRVCSLQVQQATTAVLCTLPLFHQILHSLLVELILQKNQVWIQQCQTSHCFLYLDRVPDLKSNLVT